MGGFDALRFGSWFVMHEKVFGCNQRTFLKEDSSPLSTGWLNEPFHSGYSVDSDRTAYFTLVGKGSPFFVVKESEEKEQS